MRAEEEEHVGRRGNSTTERGREASEEGQVVEKEIGDFGGDFGTEGGAKIHRRCEGLRKDEERKSREGENEEITVMKGEWI